MEEKMLVSDDSWESLVEEYPYPGILDTDFDIKIVPSAAPAPPTEEKERYVIEIPA
jgi:hypothetical protein